MSEPRKKPPPLRRYGSAFCLVGLIALCLHQCMTGFSWFRDPSAVCVDGAWDPDVLFIGTPKADERIATFTISPQEAKKIRMAGPPKGSEAWFGARADCWLLDGDWYVFDFSPQHFQTWLAGVYVHGRTGEAKYIKGGRGVVHFWENRHIRPRPPDRD